MSDTETVTLECDRCYSEAAQIVLDPYRLVVSYCKQHKIVANFNPSYLYIDVDPNIVVEDITSVTPQVKDEPRKTTLADLPFAVARTAHRIEGELEVFLQNMFESIDSGFDDDSEANMLIEYLAQQIRGIDLVDEWEGYCDS